MIGGSSTATSRYVQMHVAGSVSSPAWAIRTPWSPEHSPYVYKPIARKPRATLMAHCFQLRLYART